MTLLSRVRRLTDPRSLENGLVSSAALGALSLIDPHRSTLGGRLAYRGATAALAAATVAIEMAADDSYRYVDPLSRARLPVGAAALMLGMAEVSEVWDRRLHRFLEDRGVAQPRLVMAAGATAFSFASFALGRWVETKIPPPDPEQAPRLQVVPEKVRRLVLGMLGAIEGHSSDELRAQLETAQVKTWPTEDDIFSMIEFAVADQVPLAVPHHFTFLVKAQSTTDRGEAFQVSMLVQEGLMNSLVLHSVTDSISGGGDEPPLFESAQHWPAVDEVTFVLDSRTREK